MAAKLRGKKEIAVKEQHVGIDIEKAKGDGAVADGIKGQWHGCFLL